MITKMITKMTFKQFLESLKDDRDFNFIALTVTPWQSNGVDAYINFLRDKGCEVRGYILLWPHGVTGQAVFQENFITQDNNLKFITMDTLNSKAALTFKGMLRERIKNFLGERLYTLIMWPKNVIRRSVKKLTWPIRMLKAAKVSTDNKRIVRIICPGKLAYNYMRLLKDVDPKISVKFMLLDDGTGTLIGYQNPGIIDRFFLPRINKALTDNGRFERFTLLTRETGCGVKVNHETTGYYRKVLEVKSRKPEFTEILKLYDRAQAILATQCLTANGIVTNDEDLMIFDELFRILGEHGVKPVIKPHPRELDITRYDKYDAVVDSLSSNKITLEGILAGVNEKPKFQIGLFSSSLLHSRIFYDIPSVSLVKFLLRYNISEDYRPRIESYTRIYKGLVDMPDTYKEVEALVKKYTQAR